MFCSRCGSEQSEEATYCSKCGSPLQVKNQTDFNLPAKDGSTFSKRTKRKVISLLCVLLVIAATVATIEAVIIFKPGEARNQNSSTETNQQDLMLWQDTVTVAKQAVAQEWESIYTDLFASRQNTDGYLEIKDTRIIEIEPNSNQYFSNVSEVVEFVLYTDYRGSAPYYSNVHLADSVVFYTDGSYEVFNRNLFETYSANVYSWDYSDFIAEIHDLKSGFNETYYLR